MNDAQRHLLHAMANMRDALVRLDEAAACVRTQPGLKDMDARALNVARTNLETAYMWADRAKNS